MIGMGGHEAKGKLWIRKMQTNKQTNKSYKDTCEQCITWSGQDWSTATDTNPGNRNNKKEST